MLSKRLTEPRKVVSMFDPGLKQIKPDRRRAYAMSRKIEDLGDLSALATPLTVFTLEPMLPRYQTLSTRFDLLFAAHCSAIDDTSFTTSDFQNDDGRISLKHEAMERLPLDAVVDLGKVVFEMASVDGGPDSPFTSEGDWQERLLNIARQDAARALIGSVKLPPSKPSIPEAPKSTETPSHASTPCQSETAAGL